MAPVKVSPDAFANVPPLAFDNALYLVSWILKLNMTMWKYASPVVRMFLSIHAKFVDNALYKARRALGE